MINRIAGIRHMPTARAVVIEPFASGHRPSYVSWLASSLLRSDMDVCLIAAPPLLEHPGIVRLATAEGDRARLELVAVDAPPQSSAAASGVLGLWRFERSMYAWFAGAHRAIA